MRKRTGNIPDRAVTLSQGEVWSILAVPSLSQPVYFNLKLVAHVPVEGKANWWLAAYKALDGKAKRYGNMSSDNLKLLKASRPSLYAKVEPKLDALAAEFAATYQPAPAVAGEESF